MMDPVTKRTVFKEQVAPDGLAGGETTESEALCSVELGESAPENKGAIQIKSVKAFGFTVHGAGFAALAELDNLRAIRDGRVSVSRETLDLLELAFEDGIAALHSVGQAQQIGPEAIQRVITEVATVLSFGLPQKEG